MSMMRAPLFRPWLLAATCSSSLALGACAVDDRNSSDSPLVDIGEAQLVLADVPSDLRCVRVTAVGPGRTMVRELVPDGSTLQATLTGLPVGPVVFTGDAFSAACPSVTARTVPTWVSEPETETIVAGRLATVTLVMRLNGRAKLSLRFDDDRCGADAGCADASR